MTAKIIKKVKALLKYNNISWADFAKAYESSLKDKQAESKDKKPQQVDEKKTVAELKR